MSLLPEAVRLGPFTLLPAMVGMIAALLISVLYAKRDADRQGLDGESFTDVLTHVVVVGFVISRLSSFLIAPQESLRQPVLTLLSGGAPYTTSIAVIGSILYFAYLIRKKGFPVRPVLDALARTALLAAAVYSLFVVSAGAPSDVPWAAEVAGRSYHPINLYQAAALLAVFAWEVRSLKMGRGDHAVWRVLFTSGCLLLFISFFQTHLRTTAGLASPQWGWLVLAVIGYSGQLVLARYEASKK